MYRTNTCGELRLSNVGQKVTLAGWVQRTRKMGGMTFVDLRDRYAPIQIARNGRISDLTFATPIGETEYEFSYWEYVKSDGTSIKITSSTRFTEEIFGQDANVLK